MKILLAGGGTAGHINPAIAIAKYAMSIDPDTQILFVGKTGAMEAKLVPAEGFDIKFIDVEGLKRSFSLSNIMVLLKLIKARGECEKIIREFRPDVVVGTGGYVCAPAFLAANKLGIATLIHEQNVFPGAAIKLLSKKSTVTAISFRESTKYLANAKNILFTGNPIRPSIMSTDYINARNVLKIGNEKFIVAFGGSLGAKKINDVIIDYIPKINGSDKIRLCFATGEKNYSSVMEQLKEKNIKLCDNIKIVKYIDNMDVVMNGADLVIARSGAITISELCVLGKPSILIPSPNVTNNHQEINAMALHNKSAAKMILEKDFSAELLQKELDNILDNDDRLRKMKANALSMGSPDATDIIYRELKKMAEKN